VPDPEILAAIIGPLLTAVLAGVAVVARQWQTARNRQDEREQRLSRWREQIGFIDTWLTAHQKVAAQDPQAQAHTQRAVSDLELLYQQMTMELRNPPPVTKRFTALDLIKVILLIPVRGGAAKTLRVFYYTLVLAGLLFMIATLATFTASEDGLAFDIAVGMVVTILWFTPAIIFAVLTKAADWSARNKAAKQAGLPAPAPGWAETPGVPPGQGYLHGHGPYEQTQYNPPGPAAATPWQSG